MSYGALGLQFQRFLDGVHAARVLCVGDVILDQFVSGRVDRVSPEAPIPILHVESLRAMLGGVGNVGRNVAALGGHAVFVAVTGDDTAARQIAELAESEERLTPRLIAEAGRPSTVKTRFIAEGQQLLRADNEITEAISDATAERVIAAIRAELRRADVMVLSDYMKGVFTDEVLATVIADARAAGVPVVADPKRHAFSAYSGVTVLKPNRAELEAAARLPCTTDAEIEICARKAMREAGVDTIMVSRSDQGMSLIRRDGAPLHLQARAQAVFDVSGAGDTVVAMTAVALAVGADLAVAAELANIAGGIVVGKAGTAVVSRDELATGLVTANASYSEAKVMSSDTAVATVERWRKQGHRVGFTNGSFDVLHPGHVSLLTGARAACDRLIVAIDGDPSVRRRKNAEPPILDASARAIVLASLSVVDMVVVFSEDTAIPLFELLKPDVLIQDGDDGVERAVHTDMAGGYGGEVIATASLRGLRTSEDNRVRANARPARLRRPQRPPSSNPS